MPTIAGDKNVSPALRRLSDDPAVNFLLRKKSEWYPRGINFFQHLSLSQFWFIPAGGVLIIQCDSESARFVERPTHY
jgi:hypothetical protein